MRANGRVAEAALRIRHRWRSCSQTKQGRKNDDELHFGGSVENFRLTSREESLSKAVDTSHQQRIPVCFIRARHAIPCTQPLSIPRHSFPPTLSAVEAYMRTKLSNIVPSSLIPRYSRFSSVDDHGEGKANTKLSNWCELGEFYSQTLISRYEPQAVKGKVAWQN